MEEEIQKRYDDWFFGTFKKYHKLQMFGVDNPVVAMELSSDSVVSLVCEKPEKLCHEVLNLELPSKLYQIENQPDSIRTSRDLKIKCGTLTKNRLIDMKTLFGKSRTILSEKGVGKITIYVTDIYGTDQMEPLEEIKSKVDSARLAVDHTTDTLVVWGKEITCNKTQGFTYDIEILKRVLTFGPISDDPASSCTPYFMSKNDLMVLNSRNGSFDLYDLNSGQHIEKINLPEPENDEKWYSNTLYASSKEADISQLTLISNFGTLLTYDLRNSKTPKIYQKKCLPDCHNTHLTISYDPCNSHRNAVCGIDDNVYIIEESAADKNMVHSFKHEGHKFTEDLDSHKYKLTSSALWLPMCGRNTLLSAADDGSIQGWQYIQ